MSLSCARCRGFAASIIPVTLEAEMFCFASFMLCFASFMPKESISYFPLTAYEPSLSRVLDTPGCVGSLVANIFFTLFTLSILKTSSILSGAYTVFSNRVGFEDGLGFWGGSAVINPKGEIEKSAELFEIDKIETKMNKKLSTTQKYYLRKNE